ncbi:flagellar basal body P-ring protein FlgI, partial [Roseibium polysiphoniae]
MTNGIFFRFFAVVLCMTLLTTAALSASRIKDIADFEGIRENQLIGYGL